MPDPVWHYLAELPGRAAPLIEWNRRLRDWPVYQAFRVRFLQPTRERAMAVDCQTTCGQSCPRKVVYHSAEKIVAICPEQEAEPTPLSREEVLVYKLNEPVLHRDLCAAFGVTHRPSKLDGCQRTWRLGDFIPTAGVVFPVYLTHPEDARGLREVALFLCQLVPSPFAMIAPTRQCLSPEVERLLSEKKSVFLALDEEMAFTGTEGLQANRKPEDVFRSFLGEVPEPASGGTIFFSTPPGTTWDQIRIQFLDGHTVSVRAGNESGVFTFMQMGMASQRNGAPTKQWLLLESFSLSRGQMGWKSRDATDRQKKQKQELSNRLRAFFRLEDDPIEWLDDRKVYQCRFKILSEGAERR